MEELLAQVNEWFSTLSMDAWVYEVFVVVLVALIASVIAKKTLNKIKRN